MSRPLRQPDVVMGMTTNFHPQPFEAPSYQVVSVDEVHPGFALCHVPVIVPANLRSGHIENGIHSSIDQLRYCEIKEVLATIVKSENDVFSRWIGVYELSESSSPLVRGLNHIEKATECVLAYDERLEFLPIPPVADVV